MMVSPTFILWESSISQICWPYRPQFYWLSPTIFTLKVGLVSCCCLYQCCLYLYQSMSWNVFCYLLKISSMNDFKSDYVRERVLLSTEDSIYEWLNQIIRERVLLSTEDSIFEWLNQIISGNVFCYLLKIASRPMNY